MIWVVATPLMSTLSILMEMQMVILDWMAVEMVFVPDIWSWKMIFKATVTLPLKRRLVSWLAMRLFPRSAGCLSYFFLSLG